jgi:hypothetical protein
MIPQNAPTDPTALISGPLKTCASFEIVPLK